MNVKGLKLRQMASRTYFVRLDDIQSTLEQSLNEILKNDKEKHRVPITTNKGALLS